MKAFIYTGGVISKDGILDRPTGDDITIAADSGIKNAALLGVTVQFAVGDFDSFPEAEIPKNTEIITVPKEKDFTDTELAINTALAKGANEIVIIGGLDGRLDHTLTNIILLEDLAKHGVHVTITNGMNRIRYIESTSTLIPRSHFKYLSIVPRSPVLKGLTILGCKYSLEKKTIKNTATGFTISNEILHNCAFIAVKKGAILIVESSDKI